jgi:hypothetical protein
VITLNAKNNVITQLYDNNKINHMFTILAEININYITQPEDNIDVISSQMINPMLSSG